MLNKIFSLFASLIILLSIFVPVTVSAQSFEKSNLSKIELNESIAFQKDIQKSKIVFNTLSSQQKDAEIDKVAKQLEYMFTQAATMNEQGAVIRINYEKLEEKYSMELENAPGYQEIKNFSESQQNKLARGAFLDCMTSSIRDFIGGTLWSAIVTAGVMGFIKQMAWRQVAALIVQLAGSEFTVVALVGTLSWMAINCA